MKPVATNITGGSAFAPFYPAALLPATTPNQPVGRTLGR